MGMDEGWVYFKGDEYLTIEVSVKDSPMNWLICTKRFIVWWCVIIGINDTSKIRRDINTNHNQDKSQEGRYPDPQ